MRLFLLLLFLFLSSFQTFRGEQEIARCVSIQKVTTKVETPVWRIRWKLVNRGNRLIVEKWYPQKHLKKPPYKVGNLYTIYTDK